MLKNIIIIEHGKQVQCNTLEETVKILIDENYYNMTNNQKLVKLKTRAMANTLNNKKIIEENIDVDKTNILNNLENFFIIKDEITYIYSLLITNNIFLLERKDSNIFSRELNKEKIKDNYIIINTFAKQLLRRYINTLL